MKKNIVRHLKHTVTGVVSFIFAFTLVKASFSQEIIINGLAITDVTGSLVIFFSVLSYIYYAYFANDVFFTRIMFCTGFVLIFLEYCCSIILQVNLNLYTSIFWCDCGILGVSLGVFNNMTLAIFKHDIPALLKILLRQ